MKNTLENILKYSRDLEDEHPEKTAYWHLGKLRDELQKQALNLPVVIGCALLGVFDKNKLELREGNVIKHNDNLFLIRYSKSQKQLVARSSEGMNWRDYDWIKRTSKYFEIVADIRTDKWVGERWAHCL